MRVFSFILGLIVCATGVYARAKGVSADQELAIFLTGIGLIAYATFPRGGG